MRRLKWCLSLILFLLPSSLWATSLNFEGFSDFTPITTQYSGMVFSNAAVLVTGLSLNEFEFPPRSGLNVVSDNGGAMSIRFTTLAVDFSGYFTYNASLTLTAFDALNNPVAIAHSMFSHNEAFSGIAGSSPNERIALNFSGGISMITLTGGPLGGSFALDDVEVTQAAVPEPSSLALCGLSLIALGLYRKLLV